MATVSKFARNEEIENIPLPNESNLSPDMSVEEYLILQFEEIIKDFRAHSASLITKLRGEYTDGALAIKDLLESSSAKTAKLCVILRCLGGPHIGQKFRLEPAIGKYEDEFKIGRSTGRLFKEKGVSLYKDREISTTHAKVEIRNGQVFLTDVRSTNGTMLNGAIAKPQEPLRLRENDIITMGSTELSVHITDLDESD